MVPGFENVRVTRSSFWVREAVEDAFMTLECLDSELRAKMERGRATTEGTLFAPISSLSTTLTETPEKLSRHTMLWHACHMSQAIYYSNRPPTRLNLDRMSSRLGDFPSSMVYFTPTKRSRYKSLSEMVTWFESGQEVVSPKTPGYLAILLASLTG